LRNEAIGIAAIDMFVVASATFRLLFVTLILAHDRRKIVRFDVTQHPTAGWLSRQVTEAFPWDTAPRYLLRDRDTSYGLGFRNRVDAMRITEIVTAPRSPWQNFYIEKVTGSIRRECLDHIVVFNEPHLRRVRMGARFDGDRKQGPFADANDQSCTSGEEEIGTPIAETIGGMQRNRRGFDVKPFEEFALTTNGQHVRSDILPTPFM
jgi:hypothetical protein